MRRILALLLAAVMALSLVVVAGATGGGAGTVTLDVTAERNGDKVTYTVKMNAGENRVAAMQFLLTPSAGMKMVSDKDYQTKNFENTFVSENDEGTSFGAFGFTYKTGKYVAYGGDVDEKNRYLTGEQLIMTATYTIENEDETPYLAVSEFIACKSKVVSDADRYDCQITNEIVPVPALPGAGVTITGAVTSYNPNNAATVQLLDSNKKEVASTTVKGTSGEFTLDKVPAGTYDLVVTKPAHLTYTITGITVDSEDIDLTAKTDKPYQTITLLCGDVNEDGSITESDVSVIRLAANINKTITTAGVNPLADVNGDGSVTESDVSVVRLAAHINKSATNNCTYKF